MKIKYFLPGLILGILLWSCQTDLEKKQAVDYSKWEAYQGGPDRNQYSTLDQFTTDNVKQLKVAWSHVLPVAGQMQMNPIIIDSILYGIGPDVVPFALDSRSGKEIWRFKDTLAAGRINSRGVAYWTDGSDQRIFFGRGKYLCAVDALSGNLVKEFGEQGRLDLHLGLPDIAQEKYISSNAPGTIFNNLIIPSVRLSEGPDAAPGDIRAFDVVSGKLVWTFHTIPYPGEAGYNTWENNDAYKNINVGAVNNWSGMTLDRENEILYVPLGSAAPDFYGGNRLGDNLYSDCLLALDANTGKKLWHFQFTHHDLWDRDLPSTPNLIQVERDGKKIMAVSQTTKQGYVYVFDRFTGEPLFEIEEVPVPKSSIGGEKASKTQPIPVKPERYARRSDELTVNDISPYAENQEELRKLFEESDKRYYAPPGLDRVFLLPGYDGGAEWGGAAADPEEGILYVNSNEMAWFLSIEETKESTLKESTLGEQMYLQHCSVCHQKDLGGLEASGAPSLINLEERFERDSLVDYITRGKGMMPGLPHLSLEIRSSVAAYLLKIKEDKIEVSQVLDSYQDPYRHTGYQKFLDNRGLPGISPPWGTLNAIDLNSGEFVWKVPLGETLELKAQGHPTTGSENYGGPVVTKNGLLFIAGTKDGFIRAFDKYSGELLWEYELPAPGFATPSMYEIDGRQYLVIACGGEKLGTKKGNQIIAFSL